MEREGLDNKNEASRGVHPRANFHKIKHANMRKTLENKACWTPGNRGSQAEKRLPDEAEQAVISAFHANNSGRNPNSDGRERYPKLVPAPNRKF